MLIAEVVVERLVDHVDDGLVTLCEYDFDDESDHELSEMEMWVRVASDMLRLEECDGTNRRVDVELCDLLNVESFVDVGVAL